jgi:hypothetical protein
VAKFIPVEPEKWAEMVKAQAEVARLEAEVERLKGGQPVSDVKRHKAVGSGIVKADPKGDLVLYVDYARLKAEVERLTKSGDAMCKWIKGFNQPHISAFEWNAAKKGGQP